MTFDYNTLKMYARNGDKLGNWNGKPVLAASTTQLQNLGNGVFYILYDDENKIVAKDGKRWYSYGVVSEAGSVNEYNSRRSYNVEMPKPKPEVSAEPVYTVNYSTEERATGDVRMEIDVEATLKAAREMTVDDLLAGFNYGVEAKG